MSELIKDYFITLNCSGPLALNKKQIRATESWVGKAFNHFRERNILINFKNLQAVVNPSINWPSCSSYQNIKKTKMNTPKTNLQRSRKSQKSHALIATHVAIISLWVIFWGWNLPKY